MPAASCATSAGGCTTVRLSFFLSESLDSLRRNWVMTMASVLTVVVTMAILGVVLVTDKNLKEGTTSLTNRVEIEVFIKGTPPLQQASNALNAKIAALKQQGVVKNYTYVSQAQALADLTKMLGPQAPQIVGNLESNPLPASYKIFVKNPNQVDRVAQMFLHDPNVGNDPGSTDGVSYAKQTVRNLLGTIDLVQKAMWVVTVLFALAAILLTSTTVRLSIFARRREVEIMQLVGATSWFIRWPFILEGFITGLVGSLVAALVVWGANVLVYNWIHASKLDFLRPIKYPLIAQSGTWPLGLIPTLVLAGAMLGALGSALALRRYLRV
jgi:cell division transport system permease protein